MNIQTVDELNIPELEVYTQRSEAQLKHFYEPAEGLFICESPKVIQRALDAGYQPESMLLEEKYLHGETENLLERCRDIPLYTAPLEILTKLTGYFLTGGMLCAMRRKPLLPAEDLLEKGFRRITVLEDIENPTNIGAIFRSAAAMCLDAVILTPGCADPLYRRAARVSMGCVFQIPWTFASSDILSILHARGYKTAALALSDQSIPIDAPVLKDEEKLAFFLGNEENGLSKETIVNSDHVVKIPMAAGVDSLNVAAASAVAFWELRCR